MRIVSVAARTIRWTIASEGAARGRTERAALVLEVRSDRGTIGLGEAAPLPGLSRDTLADAEAAAAVLAARVPFDVPDPAAAFAIAAAAARTARSSHALAMHDVAAPASSPAPAARFAIETALLDALAREGGISLATLLRAAAAAQAVADPATAEVWMGRDAGRPSTAGPGPHVGEPPDTRATPARDPSAVPSSGSPSTAGPGPHVGEPPDTRATPARDPSAVPSSGSPSTPGPHVGEPPAAPTHAGDSAFRDEWDASGSVVPLGAVVDDPEAARRAVATGIRCLKIKVGRDDDLARVLAIAAAAPEATLRIDANRSWPRSEVAARLGALAGLPIEYVEEPCLDAHRLLAAPLPCPIALDESLAELTSDELDAALGALQLAALVLKPTLLGGMSAALALAARARAAGVAAIVSHGLEGPIGTAACAELALALGGDRAVGLARHPAIVGWRIEVAQLAADRVQPATAPGLGFAGLDLVTAADACSSAVAAASDRSDGRSSSNRPSRDDDRSPVGVALSVGDAALSIAQAAHRVPDGIAIETASRALTFADCAARVAAAPRPPGAARDAGRAAPRAPRAAVAIATPAIETVLAIHAALEARQPIALLHHRLAPGELQRQRAAVEAAELPADAAVVLFTSGSTGAARGVVLSRSALVAAAQASAQHLGWCDTDRWLLALSLAHAGGLSIVIRCLAAQRPIVLCDREFDRELVAQLLERCTLASLVPTQLAALLDDPAWRPPAGLRAVLLGGAAAPPALLERAAQRRVPFLTTYGMTESLGQLATAPLDRAGDPRAPLVPLAGVAFTAGSERDPAPITVRAPMLATRYLDGAPIAPAFTTADLGDVRAGALHVTGRRDDVIVTGGENVHPAAVEAVLAATPGVRAACAFGVPDERWGQIVAAALVADPAFDARAAAARWHAALPAHARPRRLAICARLPMLPSGKVDRRAAALLPVVPVDYAP